MRRTPEKKLVRQNLRLVKQLYPDLGCSELNGLRELTTQLRLSVSQGEIRWMEGGWYVTHAGLLRLAFRRKCSGICTALQDKHCGSSCGPLASERTSSTQKSCCTKGFVGYGDADPSNVSPLVHGAEMRVAETRAVNRALPRIYGVGLPVGLRNFRLVASVFPP